MTIQRTNPAQRPVSTSRANTTPSTESRPAGATPPRTGSAAQDRSVFESGARPRSLLDGSTASSTPLPSGKISVRAEPRLPIPDRGAIAHGLTVNDDVKVEQLALDLDIAHTHRGDLKVTLTSPSGRSAVVHDRSGGGADDLVGSFDLSAFAGESAKGEWKLTVEDRLGGDVGTLKSWGLNVSQAATPPQTRPTSNEFVARPGGRTPPTNAGSFFTQLKQTTALAQLSLSAAESVASGGRSPSDFVVASKLRSLSVTPLINEPDKVTKGDYLSRIAGVEPEKVYEYFVNNPNAFFGAADLKIRPATAKLQDGARLMLEQPGSPSVWFPIEVRLDPALRQINIATLDGHPLRGTNQFTFADDGQGGTRVNQISRYQLSSKAVDLGMGADDLERQSSGWKKAHAHLFEHFYPRS